MNKSEANIRMDQYKANTMNVQDSRVRRHEIIVQLRKTKKGEQMFKRRNIKEEVAAASLNNTNGQSHVTMTIEEIVEAMNSNDPESQFMGTQQARYMLSWDQSPPIDLIIDSGIVPICIRFLQNNENTLLQFEAAWALTNIASGTSEQTFCVIENDAVPHFLTLMQSKSLGLAEQSAWALANIAGDGPAAREVLIQHNVIDGILNVVNDDTPLSFLHNTVWLMSNLCRNQSPAPPFEQVKRLLPVLTKLLAHHDTQVVADTCWAFSYVTYDNNMKIQAVIDAGAVPPMVNLLQSEEISIVVPAVQSVGNIVTGTDTQTDAIITAGGLPMLGLLMQHTRPSIVKKAAWAVSNIAAGNQMQIQAALDAGIFRQVCRLLENNEMKAQKEAAWTITNSTTFGSPEQILELIEKYKIMKPYLKLLDSKEPRTVKVVLIGLVKILGLMDKLGCTENLCLMIEELGGLDKLEALQNHENEEVYNKACAIIDAYFANDDDKLDDQAANGANLPKPPTGGYT